MTAFPQRHEKGVPISSVLLSRSKELSTWLYRYRVLACMTQREMAAEYGIPRSTLSMWELGETIPSADHMAALCGYHPEHADQLMELYLRERSLRDAHPSWANYGKPTQEVQKCSENQ